LKKNPSKRSQITLATKVAGPSRGQTPWLRDGRSDLTVKDMEYSLHGSLKRLCTDVIDLYQIHWPNRSVPSFGTMYFDPSKDDLQMLSIHQQLQTLGRFVQEGKIRYIGVSNETPFGVHEFIRLAEQYQLPLMKVSTA
jgi:aryl-alcohol dehydrogenase-like predicted oxidoreductase